MIQNSNNSNGFFLMIGLIAASFILGYYFKQSKDLDNVRYQTITVKGYAQKNIESDLISWKSVIEYRNKDLNYAFNKIQKDKKRVLEYYKNAGIKESDIQISTMYRTEIYKPKSNGYGVTNDLEAYELSMNFIIESKNIDQIESLSKSSIELLNEGILFHSFDPAYYYTKIEDMKLEMLGAASENATKRAEILAKKTGDEVGKLINASQGVFQITQRNSTEVSDYGSLDTKSREKTIKAVITAEFSTK